MSRADVAALPQNQIRVFIVRKKDLHMRKLYCVLARSFSYITATSSMQASSFVTIITTCDKHWWKLNSGVIPRPCNQWACC